MFGKCRCCLKSGQHKNITKAYYRNGVREVYSDMFLDCFNLFLSTDSQLTNLICTSCINRLTEALEFKTMVAVSEHQLLREITSNNTIFDNVPEEILSTELNIKEEDVKKEPMDDDVDIDNTYYEVEIADCNGVTENNVAQNNGIAQNNGVDQNNEIADTNGFAEDNAELTETHDKRVLKRKNVTRRIPFEDFVEGEEELYARFAKCKRPRPLPNRVDLYNICPGFARHLDLLRDKVILPKMVEKLLEAEITTTVEIESSKKNLCSEKSALVTNTAVLLENSNLTPFKSKNRTGFPCFYCRHSFESLEKLKEHQTKTHKKSELRSLLKTSGAESLVVYVDTTDLKCTICNENIPNIKELKVHLIKTHKKLIYPGLTDRVIPFRLTENNIFVCQICEFSLETFGSIERHMNTHYRNYVCKECGTGFVTKYRLKVHIKSMHADESHPCDQCKKVFATQQKLKNHVDTVHKLIKRFKCPKCPERFSEYFKRQKHMVEKHGVAPLQYKCNVCDKSFDRRYTLSRHMKRDHLEERDFQCDVCSYTCFTNNELRVHMIKHNGERIYECGVCKKAYARKKTLREHMRIHNNDRRFSCTVCGQAFVQKCSLKGHMKTHHIEYNT